MKIGFLVGLALLVSVVVLAPVGAPPTDAAQDDEALQTAVADLQTRVAVLESLVVAPTDPTPGIAATPSVGRTLRGSVPVETGVARTTGKPCTSPRGFEDIATGTEVVVRDQEGRAIGRGALRSGRAVGDRDPRDVVGTRQCEFGFEIAQLPDADFYSVSIGRRGEVTYSREDLERMGWVLSLTLE